MANADVLLPCAYCGTNTAGKTPLAVFAAERTAHFCDWDCLAAYAMEQAEREH